MSVENWNMIKSLIYQTARQHFIKHKVEISGAITAIFPFLVSLRDRELITNELYKESIKSWTNQTPVQKVVYDVLEELEKKFDLSLLKILFSKTILKSYPDLNDILEDFRYAVQEEICHQTSDGKERAKNLHTQLSFKQGVDENLYQNLTWLFPEHLTYNVIAPPENELPELCELEQINVKKRGATSNSKEASESRQASEQRAQVSEPAVTSEDSAAPGNGAESPVASTSAVKRRPESTDLRTLPTSGKKACKRKSTDLRTPPTSRKKLCKKKSTDLRTPPTSGKKVCKKKSMDLRTLPTSGKKVCKKKSTDLRTPPTSGKKVCKKRRTHEESPKLSADQASRGACGSAVSTGPGKKGKDCGPRAPGHQAPGHQTPGHKAPGNQAAGHQALGHQAAGHRESEFGAPVSLSPHMAQEPIPAPISVSEEDTDTTPGMCIEIFPVICGKVMGMLIKRKLERGERTKCIRREDGRWLTPREFEVEGGCEKSSNWRNNLCCGGRKLKRLMEDKSLPDPPRIKGKKKKDNPNKCEICQDGGTLFFCKTCWKLFHGACHIPPLERNSWICTFCVIKNSQRSQKRHRESEVLARHMQPMEQLNCAFLLLKVYCQLESDIYVNAPLENYIKMASKCLEKLRTLDKIKKSLNGGGYPQVGAFVRAVDPVLRSASTSQRYDSDLIEEEFKKSFKEVFAVESTSQTGSLE